MAIVLEDFRKNVDAFSLNFIVRIWRFRDKGKGTLDMIG